MNSITFAKLKIIHTSILAPEHFVKLLQTILQNCVKSNIPTNQFGTRRHSNRQTSFISSEFLLLNNNHLPFLEWWNRSPSYLITQLHYTATNIYSLMYIPIIYLSACVYVAYGQKLCFDLYAYPIAILIIAVTYSFQKVANNETSFHMWWNVLYNLEILIFCMRHCHKL